MSTVYPMPKWGVTMENGLITEWNVKPGDEVKEGDVIGVISTDKIDVDFEAPADGVIAKLLAAEGDTLDCGEDILVMVDDLDEYQRYLSENP